MVVYNDVDGKKAPKSRAITWLDSHTGGGKIVMQLDIM